MLATSFSLLRTSGLARGGGGGGKTHLFKSQELFQAEVILASKVFSSARWLPRSLEGDGIGRQYFWRMPSSFCPLESYLFLNPIRIHGLVFSRAYKEFAIFYFSYPKL